MSCFVRLFVAEFVRFWIICGKMSVVLLFGSNVVHFRLFVQKKGI